LVWVAATASVVETEVKTSVDPDKNANSLGVAVETIAVGPVTCGGSASEDAAAGAEALSMALLGKLMTMVVDGGNADSGRLQKTKKNQHGGRPSEKQILTMARVDQQMWERR
jgi:hypothetical protein